MGDLETTASVAAGDAATKTNATTTSFNSPARSPLRSLAWLGMGSPLKTPVRNTALDIMRGSRDDFDDEIADEAMGLLSEIESEGEM